MGPALSPFPLTVLPKTFQNMNMVYAHLPHGITQEEWGSLFRLNTSAIPATAVCPTLFLIYTSLRFLQWHIC
jgi:hypothetical protein